MLSLSLEKLLQILKTYFQFFTSLFHPYNRFNLLIVDLQYTKSQSYIKSFILLEFLFYINNWTLFFENYLSHNELATKIHYSEKYLSSIETEKNTAYLNSF